jgi:hypothetical protein
VRRVQGFSAIDYGRYVLACEALAKGFDELMWIDSDVVVHPDNVEMLRKDEQPIVCGIYAKKSRPEFACDFSPGTPKISFGPEGGLHEIRYAGFGFVHVRRTVFETIRYRLALPECNKRFGKAIYPFFLPMIVADEKGGSWYLPEDYAFCDRARQCRFKILTDTTIRFWHVGSYGYTWEDVSAKKSRLAGLNVNLNWGSGATQSPISDEKPSTGADGPSDPSITVCAAVTKSEAHDLMPTARGRHQTPRTNTATDPRTSSLPVESSEAIGRMEIDFGKGDRALSIKTDVRYRRSCCSPICAPPFRCVITSDQ